MANRFLTRDEVLVALCIPMMRAIFYSASRAAATSPDDSFVASNPMRDMMPVYVKREAVDSPEKLAANMKALDEMERDALARIQGK